MSLFDFFLLFAVGMGASFFNVTSGGGSLITLPILIFMGLPSTMANATNRLAIFSQNIFAVAGFRSKGVHAWPYSLYIAISASIGALIGAKLTLNIDDQLFNKIIACVIVGVVIITVFNKKLEKVVTQKKNKKKRKWIGIILFFFIGIYGGFIQAGIGFLIIITLTNLNGFNLVKTNSAKVFVALIYTTFALGVFIYEDLINWEYGLSLACGQALGGWLVSRWSIKMGDYWLKIILFVSAVALSVKLWFFN